MKNRAVILSSRPTGIPTAEHFTVVDRPSPPPADGELLVRNMVLSVEPAMRGWVSAVSNYADPVPVGDVMRSLAVGEVVASRVPGYDVGDRLLGWFGWQELATVGRDAVLRRIVETDLPPSLALGVLGLTGATAWLALDEIGRPRAGETVVVSTGAGSVGSAAGQLARAAGCRTIAITGGAAKARQCLDLFGYDAAIDYRAEDVGARLDELSPGGADVYFDNTAGGISDAVHARLAIGARVIVCGTASMASWDPPPTGPRVERHLLTRRASMRGFLFFDHRDRFDEAVADLAARVRAGTLRYAEDPLDGLECCPDAIAGLYRGDNMGKRIIRLADIEETTT